MSFYFPYILNRGKSFFKWLGFWEQSLLRRRYIEELQEGKSIIDANGKIYTYCEEYKIFGDKLYFAQKSSKLESEEEIRDNI